jgi:hypothetical protein
VIKAQVQIPDELYKRAKEVASEKEWSFAEVVRRGLEYMTGVNPRGRTPASRWELPPARPCGPFRTRPERWTELAHDV